MCSTFISLKTLIALCVITSFIATVAEGQQCSRQTPPCEYTCHCADTIICSYDINYHCGNSICNSGWSGPKCQRGNIVLGFQNGGTSIVIGVSSFQYNPVGPAFKEQYAFDGNVKTRFESNNEQNPYLWVNLKSARTVSKLKIVTSATNPSWISGFRINVDDTSSFTNPQLCYKDPNKIQEVHEITCSKPLNGQYVRVQVPRSTILILYEMEIYGCSDYWYGDQCDKTCNCKTMSEVCDKISGHCNSGCPDRFTGSACQGCVDGWYGLGCGTQCGNCRNGDVCEKSNGKCSNGCSPGYKGDMCHADCADGSYGQGCKSQCGRCRYGKVCNKVNGTCPDGCAPGYQGDTCKNVCNDGYYGLHCSAACGICLGESACNKINGSCVNGCKPGSSPPLCTSECVDGLYGPSCAESCGKCASGEVCNKATGQCPGQCSAGYEGPLCQSECRNNTFGSACSSTCHCLNETQCNSISGECRLRGCAPGYHGDSCQLVLENICTGDKSKLVPVAVVLAVLCVLLFAGIVVFYMKSRRFARLYQEQVNAKYVKYQVNGGGEENPAADPVYEEMRDL